jgi:DnaJ-class molecular chaperone
MPDIFSGTHYDILGVERTATTDDINAAFRKMSMSVYPDKNPANTMKATRLFKQVITAYECLKDNARRMAYDRETFRMPQPKPRPRAPGRWPWQ